MRFRKMILESLDDRRMMAWGDFDSTFGDNGSVQLENEIFVESRDLINRQLQSFAGTTDFVGSVTTGKGQREAIIRFNAEGSLDTSFGDGGRLQFGNTSSYSPSTLTAFTMDISNRVTKVSSEGKQSISGFVPQDFVVRRFQSNGELDSTFGDNGFVRLPAIQPRGVSMQSDAAGNIYVWTSEGDHRTPATIRVWKLTSSGAFDAGYGTGGQVTITDSMVFADASSISIDFERQSITAVALFARRNAGESTWFWGVQRWNLDATPDNSFGDNQTNLKSIDLSRFQFPFMTRFEKSNQGWVLHGNVLDITQIISGPYTEFVLYDNQFERDIRFSVARVFNPNLQSGFPTFSFDSSTFSVDSTGNLLLIAKENGLDQSTWNLLRFTSSGTLDPIFGTAGIIRVSTANDISISEVERKSAFIMESNSDYILVFNYSNFLRKTPRASGDRDILLYRISSQGEVLTNAAGVAETYLDASRQYQSSEIRGLRGDQNSVIVETVTSLTVRRQDPRGNVSTYRKVFQDGEIDSSWGNEGKLIVEPFKVAETIGEFWSMLRLPSGEFLQSYRNNSLWTQTVVRLRTDGSLDKSFGEAGYLTFSRSSLGLTSPDENFSVSTGSERITVRVFGPKGELKWLTAFNLAGVLDNNFGVGGKWTFPPDLKSVRREISHQSGFFVEGMLPGPSPAEDRLYIVSFNKDGSIDSSFGNDGRIFVDPAKPIESIILLTPELFLLTSYDPTGVSKNTFLRVIDRSGNAVDRFGINGSIEINTRSHSVRKATISDKSVIVVITSANAERSIENLERFLIGSTTIRIFNLDGLPISGFGNNGTLELNSIGLAGTGFFFKVNNDGSILLNQTTSDASSTTAFMYRLEGQNGTLSKWHNFRNPFDTSNDTAGTVTPLDVLLVINDINARGIRQLRSAPATGDNLVDVNGDNWITPLDILLVINQLNLRSTPIGGEGEASLEPRSIQAINTDAVLSNARFVFPSYELATTENSALETNEVLRQRRRR